MVAAEGSATLNDIGSIETEGGAVVNAKNVTGSVAISWITRAFGMEADVDGRDWSKWRYRRTVPSARPTARKERVDVSARVVIYACTLNNTSGINQNRAYRVWFPCWLHFGGAEEGRRACPLIHLSQIPYFQNRRAHIIFVLAACESTSEE